MKTPVAQPARTVADAIRRTRAFYDVGVRSLEQYPDLHLPHGSSRQLRPPRADFQYLRHARRVAYVSATGRGSVRGYTADELEDLIDRCQAAGFPLAPAHLMLLRGVPVKARWRVEQQMIAGGWSRRRLADAIRARQGRGREPVRKPAAPGDGQEAAGRLLRLGEQLDRLVAVTLESRVEVPAGLKRSLVRNRAALLGLCRQARAALDPSGHGGRR